MHISWPCQWCLHSAPTSPFFCQLQSEKQKEKKKKSGAAIHKHLCSESVNYILKKRAGTWSRASCREAAVTASAAHSVASSPVVSVSLSSYSSSLLHPVLCPIIHDVYICGVCSTRHPSSTFDVITLCTKHLMSLFAKPWPLEQNRSCSTHRHSVLKETWSSTLLDVTSETIP